MVGGSLVVPPVDGGDERPAAEVRVVLGARVEEVGVEEEDVAGMHLDVHQVEAGTGHRNTIQVGAGLDGNAEYAPVS